MADNARGPAWENGAPDERTTDISQGTPRDDPLPPGFLDLGNGQLFGGGTEAELLAAADWLDRNYPERSQDPPTGHTGPILNMLIHHSRLASGFAKLPNETTRDERLSFAARGVLSYLLSLPNGWKTNADELAEHAAKLRGKRGEGRRAMRAIFAELKKAGYLHTKPVCDPATGRWSTEMYLYDRPHASDVPLTDVPVTGTSVRAGQTSEPVDNGGDSAADTADDVSAARTDVPVTDVPLTGSRLTERRLTDTSVSGTSSKKTDHRKTEDELARVGDGVDDWGDRGNHPREQPKDDDQGQDQRPGALRLPQVANSKTASSRLNGQAMADGAQEISFNDAESATAGIRRAHEDAPGAHPDGLDEFSQVAPTYGSPGVGGAAAPLSEPAKPAASDAIRPGRWRSPQRIAAEQAAESRARRLADEAAAQ